MRKEFDDVTLYAVKNQRIRQWRSKVEGSTIHTYYGDVGGKQVHTSREASPKNIGKSNHRTAREQAILEHEARIAKKMEREGYRRSLEEAKASPVRFPMLAKRYRKRKKKVRWNDIHLAQPKLDGVRACYYSRDGEPHLYSRKDSRWENLEHLEEELSQLLDGSFYVDGEIWHPDLEFRQISGLVKKKQTIELEDGTEVSTSDLEYHIYDIVDLGTSLKNQPMIFRKAGLEEMEGRAHRLGREKYEHLQFVETVPVRSEEDLEDVTSSWVLEGYEGAILRLAHGLYEFDRRSNYLLKVKSFQDDEFRVVGYTTGKGRFEGCVIWRCETEEGETFTCVPKGSLEEKKRLYKEAPKHVGKLLKVQFFERDHITGVPRFPVGKGFRLEEDV